MRKLLMRAFRHSYLAALLLISFSASAQKYTPNPGYFEWDGGRFKNHLTPPRRDTSTITGKIDTIGSIVYWPATKALWNKTDTGWAKVGSGIDLSNYYTKSESDTRFLQATIVSTVEDLAAHSPATGDSLMFVTDSLRGGLFYWSPTLKNDNGTKFGNWWRLYDKSIGLNVCWFGAKGDGVTDDTQPIKDALAAVGQGGSIYFPNRCDYPAIGTTFYNVTPGIVINKTSIKLYSDAESKGYSTNIRATSGSGAIFIVMSAEVGFWGLTLRGNGAFTIIDGSGAGRWAEGATINGIEVRGDAGSNGDIKIQHCGFFYLDTAIVFKARNADLTDNVFAQDKYGAVIVPAAIGQNRGFKFQNNWFHSIGDTTVGRAVFKSADPDAFQIWIHNNQVDGQTNCILADIVADSAVQITANNNTLGRGGMIKLTGVDGAVIADNYYLGGSWQTRGNGIELVNCTNVTVNDNNIDQAAVNGVQLTNSSANIISNNIIKDFSWKGKATAIAGSYNGILLDSDSKKNMVHGNILRITGPQGITRPVNFVDTLQNRIYTNTYSYQNTNLPDSLGNEFASGIKVPAIMFSPYNKGRVFDISYVNDSVSLYISRTGLFNFMRFQHDGKILINKSTNPLNAHRAYADLHTVGSLRFDLDVVSQSDGPGDMYYRGEDSILHKLPIGIGGQLLRVNFSNPRPEWFTHNFISVESDPIVSARTIGISSGLGIQVTGGTQDLSASRSWTITNTGILNQTASEETKSFWVQNGSMRTLTLRGTTNPLITFNDGSNTAILQFTGGNRLDFNNNNAYTSFTGNSSFGIGTGTPVSKFEVAGSTGFSITSTSTNLTLGNHRTIRATASGITLTLPAASSCAGREYCIINYNTGGNINISAFLSPTAVSTTTIATGTMVWIQSDGTNWYQIK